MEQFVITRMSRFKYQPEKKLDFKLHAAPIMGLFWVPGNDDRSILLCISMEGILNIWDAGNSTNLKSSELFANDANFTEDMRDNVTKNVLIFNAVLSPMVNILHWVTILSSINMGN